MTETIACPVCGSVQASLKRTTGDVKTVNCPVCGDYMITGSSAEVLSHYDLAARRARLEHAKRGTQSGGLPLISEA